MPAATASYPLGVDDESINASEAVAQWANADPRRRFILTRSMSVIWASASAHRFLDDATVLHRAGTTIRLTDHSLQTALTDLVTGANDDFTTWHMTRPAGLGEFLFVARRTCPEADLVGLWLQDTSLDFQPQWADFAGAFALTPAEYRVAVLLLDGHSVERAASKLALGESTIRSHVKRLYLKLEVTSKEEMFRRVAGFRIV